MNMVEEWFTLESISKIETNDKLYCISVDSPEKQFLAGEMGVPTHNTDAGKEEDSLKGEAQMIIGSIARLGRAAGVHLIIATQRPDASLLPGETKANLGVRVNCGRTDSNASSMILGNGEGARVKSNPRGRLYLRIFGSGNHGQGFFADPSWIDEYLASKGLNPDGTPISQPQSKLAKLTDFSELEDGDLDSREGVNNDDIIAKIKEEEATRFTESFEDDDDWGLLDDEIEEEKEVPTDRPLLTGGKTDDDKFHRPEEDFDAELEALIEENFN